MNLAKIWSGDQFSDSDASIFPVFHKEKVLGAVWTDYFLLLNLMKSRKNGQNSALFHLD